MAPSRWVVGLMALLLLCLPTGPLLAQDRISSDVATSTSFTDQQRGLIRDYVANWSTTLATGADREVTQAREKLLEPFRYPGASREFVLLYSQQVSGALREAAGAESMLVRLNAMIVLREGVDPEAARLILSALGDQNAAVRFAAAKAAAGYVRQAPAAQKQVLHRPLAEALQREDSEPVLEQLLVGLAEIPGAELEQLEWLNARIDRHAARPGSSLKADLQGWTVLYRRLVTMVASGQDVPADRVREVAKVATRYLDLSARVLERRLAREESVNDYRTMADSASKVLIWASRSMQAENHPAAIDTEIRNSNWPGVLLRAQEWKAFLGKPPFNIPRPELEVAMPQGGAAAPVAGTAVGARAGTGR